MNEPSDLARDVLARYRRSISPSVGQREAVVQAAVRRANGGPAPGGGSAPSGGGSPWLVVLGAALVIGAGALWSARAPSAGVVDAAFDRPPAFSRAPEPPTIAVASVPAGDPVRAMPSAAPEPAVSAAPARTVRAPRPPAAASRETPDTGLIDEEVRLLREANVALREGRDAVARERFDEHARRFPDGSLVELREVGRAIMRCRGASAEVAAATITAFSERFPASPHLARLARECPTTDAR